PLHADPRLVAESGGVVLQRVGAAVVAAGELQVGGAVQRTAGALVGGLQRPEGAPLPVDVHGRAAGAWDAVQPDTTATQVWAGLVRSRPESVRKVLASTTPLQQETAVTGGEVVKRSSSFHKKRKQIESGDPSPHSK